MVRPYKLPTYYLPTYSLLSLTDFPVFPSRLPRILISWEDSLPDSPPIIFGIFSVAYLKKLKGGYRK